MSRLASSRTRAAASLGWLGVSAVALLSFSVAGVALGFSSLLASTGAASRAIECCGTIFSRCLISSSMLRATLPWIAMALLLWGLVRAARNAWRTLRANRRFVAGLADRQIAPFSLLEETAAQLGLIDQVRVLDGVPGRHASTAGILRPRIHVTRDLCETLSREELTAVLLHEDHHRRSRDPLRAFVVLLLQDLLFFLPVGYVLGRIFFEAQEDAADDAVESKGGDPLELASALCRLATLEAQGLALAGLTGVTGSGKVGRRVERLISPHRDDFQRPGACRVIASVFIGALVVVSLYLPIAMPGSPFVFHGCNPEYCRAIGCMR